MLKTNDTPAKHKKQKGDNDLGVSPLPHEILLSKPAPVATLVRSTVLTANQGTDATNMVAHTYQPVRPLPTLNQGVKNSTTITRLPGPLTSDERMQPDYNQNVLMDQHGNSIEMRASVGQQPGNSNVILVDNPIDQQVPLTMDSLCSYPLVQNLVDESVAILETKMKMESCLTGTAKKKTAHKDLSFGQFVVGFIQNILGCETP